MEINIYKDDNDREVEKI